MISYPGTALSQVATKEVCMKLTFSSSVTWDNPTLGTFARLRSLVLCFIPWLILFLFASNTHSPDWRHAVISNLLQPSRPLCFSSKRSKTDAASQSSAPTGSVVVRQNVVPSHRHKGKWCHTRKTTEYTHCNLNSPSPGTRLRRNDCGNWAVASFFTQKASHKVRNDLICMHCPLQICVAVGLHPQWVCHTLNYQLPLLTLPSFSCKLATKLLPSKVTYSSKSFVTPWNVKADGVQWDI